MRLRGGGDAEARGEPEQVQATGPLLPPPRGTRRELGAAGVPTGPGEGAPSPCGAREADTSDVGLSAHRPLKRHRARGWARPLLRRHLPTGQPPASPGRAVCLPGGRGRGQATACGPGKQARPRPPRAPHTASLPPRPQASQAQWQSRILPGNCQMAAGDVGTFASLAVTARPAEATGQPVTVRQSTDFCITLTAPTCQAVIFQKKMISSLVIIPSIHEAGRKG